MRREQRFKELIATHMSPDLQGIVVAHCYARYLQDVPYFQYKPAHLRGIGRLRAEEETTRFLTQVRQAAASFYCFSINTYASQEDRVPLGAMHVFGTEVVAGLGWRVI